MTHCVYFNNQAPEHLIKLHTGAFCKHMHHEKNLCKNLCPPNFSSFMNPLQKPPLKSLLSVTKVLVEFILQNFSIFVILKNYVKTYATRCSPCSDTKIQLLQCYDEPLTGQGIPNKN